jgi:hypothetical protein
LLDFPVGAVLGNFAGNWRYFSPAAWDVKSLGDLFSRIPGEILQFHAFRVKYSRIEMKPRPFAAIIHILTVLFNHCL